MQLSTQLLFSFHVKITSPFDVATFILYFCSAVNFYLAFFIVLLVLMVIFCTVMHYAVDWYPGVDGEY